jgi:hypothetical protein
MQIINQLQAEQNGGYLRAGADRRQLITECHPVLGQTSPCRL